jgi:hypothetical protein
MHFYHFAMRGAKQSWKKRAKIRKFDNPDVLFGAARRNWKLAPFGHLRR